jgi:hypothetical protein
MTTDLRTRLWQRLLATGLALTAAACGSGGTEPSPPGIEPAPAGSLEVSVTMVGPPADPGGLEVLIDGRPRGSLDGAGRAVVAGVAPGPHTVELGGVASTCTVAGGTRRSVEVASGASTGVAFAMSCAAPTGSLRILAHTLGENPDPDGYLVRLDGAGDRVLAIEGTLEVADLAAGDHRIELSGVASNCAVTGAAERMATITPAQQTTVVFDVTCEEDPVPPAGAKVIVRTSSVIINAPQDLLYTAVLDGTFSLPVPASGAVTFETVPGQHSILLRVPFYCAVGGFERQPNPVSVTVSAGQTQIVRFGVLCIG